MFNAHLKELTVPLSSSLCNIRATAHKSWGWHCSTLKISFHTLICSKLDYTALAWQPWLSAANLSCLDHLQNCSIWLITGYLASWRSELPHMQQPINPESLRKGIAQHQQSYKTCCFSCWHPSKSSKSLQLSL